jgi:DMSO/TMAO reductase YedYZ molybdopterin-dependent catalytic subunit
MSAPPLPPNQQLAAPGKWPVVGEKGPRRDGAPWTITVAGLVEHPRVWTLPELAALPAVERAIDIHCVTRWSRLGARFSGIPLSLLLDAAGPLPEARFVSFVARSERGHSTSLPLADALALDTLVALAHEGAPLEEIHGGPVRAIVPGRYFYKSVKWLERVELLPEDRLGYWEAEAGYHNTADPWREQRYIASSLDRRTVAALLESRDFSGRDLLGIDAAGRVLDGLNARAALLRDADFRKASLREADFAGANLSNARLQGADLRRARFHGADLEGADFRGADLQGADLQGASLFGATFCEAEPDAPEPYGPARLDPSTRVDDDALSRLSPAQERFVQAGLGKGGG